MLRLFVELLSAACCINDRPTLADRVPSKLVFLERSSGIDEAMVAVGCSCIPLSESKDVAVVRLDIKVGKIEAEEGEMTLR